MIQSATGLPLEDARSRKVSGVFVLGSEPPKEGPSSEVLDNELPIAECATTTTHSLSRHVYGIVGQIGSVPGLRPSDRQLVPLTIPRRCAVAIRLTKSGRAPSWLATIGSESRKGGRESGERFDEEQT